MTANVELQEALDFHAFFSEFRVKKQINWNDYEDQLRVFMLSFFNKTGCQRHFEEFDDSFAYLSPDIIHDVVVQIDEASKLGNLIDVQGTWGAEALSQRDHLASRKFGLSKTVIDDTKTHDGAMFKKRWTKVVCKAPELYGKLHLDSLCNYAFKSLYGNLNPVFEDLTLMHHFSRSPYSQDQIKPLRVFLVKQLQAPILRKLHIAFKGDLGLEKELMGFCMSNNFEALNWNCAPQSPEFFIRIFNAFLTKRFPPDCKTREIRGYFHRSALKEFVQALKLKVKHEEPKDIQREERCLVAADRTISVAVSYRDNARVAVCIALKYHDDHSSSSSTAEIKREEKTDEDNVQFEDVDYEEDSWRLSNDLWHGCNQSCKLEELLLRIWTEDDCVDCKSCHLCKPDDYYYDGEHYPKYLRECDCYPQKNYD